MNLLIIVGTMTLISVAACIWCSRSQVKLQRTMGQRPQAKIIKLSLDIEKSLQLDFEIIQSC